MSGDLAGPVVVLSPHLDDAVLSAWAVLRTAPEADVRVVVVFAGIPPAGTVGPADLVFGTSDSPALVRRRRAEDLDALGTLGLVPVHLDHLDGQYRDAPVDPVLLAASITDVVPAASSIVAPAGIGRHPDHLAVRSVALDLAAGSDADLWLYADLPYASHLGWPAWVTGRAPDPHLVPEAAWARVLGEVAPPERLDPVVARFDDAERDAKLDAARRYRSQWSALEGGPHTRMSHPAVAGYEVRWRVSRPA